MSTSIESVILNATGARAVRSQSSVQSLWSGYGSITRYQLSGGDYESVIVKHIHPGDGGQHPRGWGTDLSHQRKLQSYQVESHWYAEWAHRCDDGCRVPKCLAVDFSGEDRLILLEDLSSSGYPDVRQRASLPQLLCCLRWLAHLHAKFMGEAPEGLWQTGTYWHLATRPDELETLSTEDPALFAVARAIDQKLNDCTYQTIVHGDAKLANFCFSSSDEPSVAAVDFQYVGGGCGMKDVAYCIGSCLDEDHSEKLEPILLNAYFDALREALKARTHPIDFAKLETEWRGLYAWAWTDFHRFLKGWSPGHWKINRYSERLAKEVIAQID